MKIRWESLISNWTADFDFNCSSWTFCWTPFDHGLVSWVRRNTKTRKIIELWEILHQIILVFINTYIIFKDIFDKFKIDWNAIVFLKKTILSFFHHNFDITTCITGCISLCFCIQLFLSNLYFGFSRPLVFQASYCSWFCITLPLF